jgi:hypothetical protein
VTFREVVLLLPPVALVPRSFRAWPTRDDLLVAAAGLVAGVGVTVAIHLWVTTVGTYGYTTSGMAWLTRRDPLDVLLGWLNTYGPLVFLLPFGARQPRHIAFLAGVFALTWIGGYDMERFAIWAMPVVLLVAGRAFEGPLRRHPAVAVGVVVGALLVFRAFFPLPQPTRVLCPGALHALGVLGPCPLWLDLQYWHASDGAKVQWRHVDLSMLGAVALLLAASVAVTSRRGAAAAR